MINIDDINPLTKISLLLMLSLNKYSISLIDYTLCFNDLISTNRLLCKFKLQELEIYHLLNQFINKDEKEFLSQLLEVFILCLTSQNETNKQAKNCIDFIMFEDFLHFQYLSLKFKDNKFKEWKQFNEILTNFEIITKKININVNESEILKRFNFPLNNVKKEIKFNDCLMQTKINLYLNLACQYNAINSLNEIAFLEHNHINQLLTLQFKANPLNHLTLLKFASIYAIKSILNDNSIESEILSKLKAYDYILNYQIKELKQISNLLDNVEVPPKFNITDCIDFFHLKSIANVMKNRKLLLGELIKNPK